MCQRHGVLHVVGVRHAQTSLVALCQLSADRLWRGADAEVCHRFGSTEPRDADGHDQERDGKDGCPCRLPNLAASSCFQSAMSCASPRRTTSVSPGSPNEACRLNIDQTIADAIARTETAASTTGSGSAKFRDTFRAFDDGERRERPARSRRPVRQFCAVFRGVASPSLAIWSSAASSSRVGAVSSRPASKPPLTRLYCPCPAPRGHHGWVLSLGHSRGSTLYERCGRPAERGQSLGYSVKQEAEALSTLERYDRGLARL